MSKPQTNYHCCLQFSYLTSKWILPLYTVNIPETFLVFTVFDSKSLTVRALSTRQGDGKLTTILLT